MILAALNRLRPSQKNTSGNAMIYVLVAIALFGILTATLSNQNNQSDGQDIDDEMVALYANELLEYSAAAKQVVDQMIMTGSTIDDLDFVNPSSAAFDTPPHIHKVFHPQGGGLNYQFLINSKISASSAAWYVNNTTNVEWTESTSNDILISAVRIKKEICEKINTKITGNNNIPLLSTTALMQFFDPSHTPKNDLNSTTCAGCEGFNTLCVAENSDTLYGFYTILAAR